MPDWNKRTSSTRYRFMRVSRATGLETERLTMLKGGTITRNNDVRILESAEVERVGELEIGADLVRIYMDATWPSGEKASEVLGTFIPSVSKRSIKGRYKTATVQLRGRLQELLDDGFASPLTLPKGTNAVAAAAKICTDMGLEVIADPSDYTITNPRVYGIGVEQNDSETGSTKLDAVNNLLSLAGFWAAKTDTYGRILLRRYIALADRPSLWEFAEGPDCKFEKDMENECEMYDVANHVVCVFSSSDMTIVGEVWDRDPSSPYSTVSIGRTITKGYTFSDVPAGEDGRTPQQIATTRAKNYLKQNQSVIDRYSLRHAYAPVGVTDAVHMSYPTAGVEGKFEIRVQNMSLSAGCPTETEIRRFIR